MNILLYLFITIVWSSTYYAVKLQMGTVAPMWSVAYRFGLAATILILYCLFTKRSLRFNLRSHLSIALQGALLFSGNYILFYLSTPYLITGLIAIIFATLVIMNIFHSRVFFKTPLLPNVILGALVGLTGLCLAFWSEIKSLGIEAGNLHHLIVGILLAVAATVFASWGSMATTYNQGKNLPTIETNALGMLYGTILVIFSALLLGEKPSFDWHFTYLASLTYLVLIGTIFAFGAYITLIKRIGATKASYSFVVIPILAMTISTFFEGFRWSESIVFGAVLIVLGNIMVLYRKSKLS